MPYYLVKEEVKGYMEYLTEADSAEEAMEKCATMVDTYGADLIPKITDEEIVDATEIDLDDVADMEYTMQRAVKWFKQDILEEPDPDVKPKRKRKKKKAAKVVKRDEVPEAPEPVEAPKPVKSKVPDYAVDVK